jgi:hypothetical protein
MNRSQHDMDDAAELVEVFRLIDGLEDIMPVDVEHGTIGLNVQTDEDVEPLATAMARTKALHNKLVQQGKIGGRIIP